MKPKNKKTKTKTSKKDTSKDKSIKSEKSLKSSNKSIKTEKTEKSKNSHPDQSPTHEEAKNLNSNLTPPDQNYQNIKPFYPNQKQPNFQPFQSQRPMGAAIEKCDGCFEGEAVCYCKNCEKSYCVLCDEQIHIIPAYRAHERIPLSQMAHLKKLCYHHGSSLKFYCESCEEPICNECQVIGPHNTKLHRIANIMQTYNTKYQNINNIVQNSLMKKYDILTENLGFIEQVIEEVENTANNIEREINISFNSMLEHLKSEKGKRIAILSYESSTIQKDIVKIDEILKILKDSNEENDMIEFLLKYNQINDQLEKLISKPTVVNIDKNISKFPTTFADQQRKLSNYNKLEKVIKVKDDIIWSLIQNSQNNQNEINLELNHNVVQNERYGMINNNKQVVSGGLVKEINDKVKRGNINLYQLFCEFEEEGEKISIQNIPHALMKMEINVNEQDIGNLMRDLGFNEEKVFIRDLTKGIVLFKE